MANGWDAGKVLIAHGWKVHAATTPTTMSVVAPTRCGHKGLSSSDPARVTCKRCQAILKAHENRR
jgi:hypothetical protein